MAEYRTNRLRPFLDRFERFVSENQLASDSLFAIGKKVRPGPKVFFRSLDAYKTKIIFCLKVQFISISLLPTRLYDVYSFVC